MPGGGRILGHDYPSLYLWADLTVLISVAPVVQLLVGQLAGHLSGIIARIPRPYPVVRQRRIGEVLVRERLLSVQQLDQLLDLQATTEEAWQRLGDLAVEQGYVDSRRLAELIRA